MTEYEAYQEHIRYTHDTYCRIVIRHASFDAARMLAARWAGSRRVEHRFHCVAFGPVAMAVAASLAPGVAVVLEGELAEARAASFLDGRPRRAEAGGKSEIKVSTFLKVDAR